MNEANDIRDNSHSSFWQYQKNFNIIKYRIRFAGIEFSEVKWLNGSDNQTAASSCAKQKEISCIEL